MGKDWWGGRRGEGRRGRSGRRGGVEEEEGCLAWEYRIKL